MLKQKMRRALLIPASLLFAACNAQDGEGQAGSLWWFWLLVIIAALVLALRWWRGRQRGQNASPAVTPEMRPAAPAKPIASATPAEPITEPEPAPVTEVEVEEVRETDVDAAAEVETTRTTEIEVQMTEPDDLRKIEGIGPKISQTLNDAGITTFAALAATDADTLRQILDDAGISRIADPTTWPEQARFAAAGDWEGLGVLQDSLKGGRKID